MTITGTLPNFRSTTPIRARGFTLIELLVVIAIIALLIGILLPSLGRARETASGVRDASAVRQLMISYSLYTDDNAGAVLPGYLSGPLGARTEVIDFRGNRIGNPVVQRYPWRIIDYLGDDFGGLYKDPNVRASLNEGTYALSVFPSFGINSFYVGGSGRDFDVFNSESSLYRLFKRGFYVSRDQQVARPSNLLVFTASRSKDEDNTLGLGAGLDVEGFHEVIPPITFAQQGRKWDDEYQPDATSPGNNSGAVSIRYNDRAATGFFDGHAEQLNWEQLNDMSRWSNDATTPDWPGLERIGQ